MKINSETLKGISTIVGGFCLYFIFGSIYTWSAMNAYYASYLKNNIGLTIHVKESFWFMPTIMLVEYPFLTPGLKLGNIITVRG